MAVLEEFQKKGIGHILLKHGEKLLKEKHVNIVWCNAREVALEFYKKNGYKITGNSFNIEDIGTHYAMYKNI